MPTSFSAAGRTLEGGFVGGRRMPWADNGCNAAAAIKPTQAGMPVLQDRALTSGPPWLLYLSLALPGFARFPSLGQSSRSWSGVAARPLGTPGDQAWAPFAGAARVVLSGGWLLPLDQGLSSPG